MVKNQYQTSNLTNNLVNESAQQPLFNIKPIPFPPAKKTDFTFIDLFAGIGGFRLALQNLKGKCLFSSEWEKEAQKTYNANFGETPFGDITKKEVKDFIPSKFDILCGGFPCQPFSAAGVLKGFEDTRGTLFFDILDILQKKKPKVVFLENVKNLIYHNKGNTFKTMIKHLESFGYIVSYEVLNAVDFGVAQNRQRIIIICTKKKKFDFSKIKKLKKKASIKDIIDIKEKENWNFLNRFQEGITYFTKEK